VPATIDRPTDGIELRTLPLLHKIYYWIRDRMLKRMYDLMSLSEVFLEMDAEIFEVEKLIT
jgi:hypothetical protein